MPSQLVQGAAAPTPSPNPNLGQLLGSQTTSLSLFTERLRISPRFEETRQASAVGLPNPTCGEYYSLVGFGGQCAS